MQSSPAKNGSRPKTENGSPPPPVDFEVCPVCRGPLQTPKVLPCLHTFCARCLDQCLQQSGVRPGGSFLCPSCRCQVAVPRRGVQAFPDSVLHVSMSELEEKKKVPTEKKKVLCTGCEQNLPAIRKCVECDDWLCSTCCNMHAKVKVTREHHLVSPKELSSGEHDDLLMEGFEPLMCTKHDEPLKLFCTELACMAPICTVCKTTLGHDGHRAIELHEQARYDVAMLQKLVPGVQRSLVAAEKKLSNVKLEEKITATGRKDIHRAINTRLEHVTATLAQQLGAFAENLHEQVEKMAKEHKGLLSEELSEAQYKQEGMRCAVTFAQTLVEFNRPEEVVSMARLVGRRLEVFQKSPDTSAPGWRQPRLHPPNPLTELQVEKLFGGLTLMGEIIQCVLVRSFSAKLDDDKVKVSLSDVAVTEDNDIMLVDKDNKRVKVFDNKGQLLFATDQRQFRTPNRVTLFQASGRALIKDEKVLKVLDQDGTTAGQFAPALRQPVGLAQTHDGNVLISDWDSGHVHCFNEGGAEVFHFNCASEAPAYIAAGSSGHVAVSDWKRNAVRVFTPNGNLHFQYGGDGANHGHLNHPYGVAMDVNGYLIIADNWNNSIHLVSRDGRFLRHLLTEENGLKWPQALAIDKDKHLVVAELSGTVKIYQYLA